MAQQTADIGRFMQYCQTNFRFNGVVLLADSNKIIYEHAFGKANRETKEDNELSTRFRIGSISKQFTSFAMLRLIEERKLSFNDQVAKYIGKFNRPGKQTITIRNLLTHTSGLPDYTNFKKFNEKTYYSEDSLTDMIAAEPISFPPSTAYGYSNSNFYLLALIVEKITGLEFGAALNQMVLTEAGMVNSGEEQDDPVKHEAKAWLPRGDSAVTAPYIEMKNTKGGGGMYSTAEDLLKWSLFLQHKLAVDAFLKNAIQPVTLSDGTKTIYACGWCLLPGLIMHEGHINGFANLIAIDTSHHQTIILLTNDDYQHLYITMHSLQNILRYNMAANDWMANKPVANLEDYRGAFSIGDLTVHIKDTLNHLEGDAFGQKQYLNWYGTDEFFFLNMEGILRFERDSSGKVIALKSFENYSWVTLKKE
jgi:CubicO group peptidase (beta-lactamase class C family)